MDPVLNMDLTVSFHIVSVSVDLADVSFEICDVSFEICDVSFEICDGVRGTRSRVALESFCEYGFMGPVLKLDSLALF